MRNLKIICQGEVCNIDKPPNLSIETLKNMTPGKDGKLNIFLKTEILATNIDYSQILKNICQQLLSLNNVLKVQNEYGYMNWREIVHWFAAYMNFNN